MKVLAFDCTAPIVTVGLVDGNTIIGRWDSPATRTRGNVLERCIDRALAKTGWKRSEIEGLALVLGPGSLTATRIGWATAAGWAEASGIPVAGWSTIDVQERYWTSREEKNRLCVIHQRGESFYGYQIPRDRKSAPPVVLNIEGWEPSGTSEVSLVGPGILGYRARWKRIRGVTLDISDETEAIVGGDLLAQWGHEAIVRGQPLSLTKSPLEYGLSPDFKKRKSA
jgi:tRNA threonylcarbamoyl adenosine modification protein YeaZ